MLIDMAALTVFSWLVAKALNMVFFKAAPASNFVTWTLTFGYFIFGVILASVVKFFRGAAISKSLGISMSAQSPMDMGTAFIMALIFYQVLNRTSKKSVNGRVQAYSTNADSSLRAPVATSIPAATSTQYAVTPPHVPTDQPGRAIKSSSSVHESVAVDEGAIYTAIANELESGAIDKGLWTRLFAECDGDESRTKAAYIRQRANQLLARNHLIASQGISEASSNAPPPVESALSGNSEKPSAPAKLTSPANYRRVLMVVVALIVGGALLYWVSGKPRFSNSKMADSNPFDKYVTPEVNPSDRTYTTKELFGAPVDATTGGFDYDEAGRPLTKPKPEQDPRYLGEAGRALKHGVTLPKATGNSPDAATPANSATNPSPIDCEANAVSKDGRPLIGRAKVASIKKCCEANAVSKDGRHLQGAAKTFSIKRCSERHSAERGNP